MKMILGASSVFICDQKFSILENAGVLFDCDSQATKNQILEIDSYESLRAKYPHLPQSFHQDCVLLPALHNAHIHFEFSNNLSQLNYGSFASWLESVITHREELFENLQASIQREIALQLSSGVASVGAISSYGYDIPLLAQSPLRITLFNEAIGNNPSMLDALFGNLKERLEECQNLKSPKFSPALAIHSPYSTHFVLAKQVALLAQKQDLKISCHFLESLEEKQWLQSGSGWFQEFFQNFFQVPNAKPSMNILEFLEILKDLSPLFVHCLFADSLILNKISQMQGFIACAPRSNRLLNCKLLNLQKCKEANLSPIFSTDGLSSNFSLNLIEEIRTAFFGYAQEEVLGLAQDLILGITHFPALALGIASGEIAVGKFADLALFECKGISKSQQKPLHFVLHANSKVKRLYINGKGVQNGTTL